MSYLSSLESRYAALKRERSDCEAKLKVQKKRKSDVEGLIRVLCRVSEEKVDSVNKSLRSIKENLMSGVTLGSKFVSRAGEMDGAQEKDSGSDSQISAALDNLQKELSATERRITEYEGNIRSLSSQIDRVADDIRDEKRRIAEEEAEELLEKIKEALNFG